MTQNNTMLQIRIKELEEQAKKINEELNQINRLREAFPDLEVTKNRWGTVRYYAESANSLVNDYYTKHSCGCCNDAPLYVYPFLYFEGIKVHSKPDHFCIGEKNTWGYGDLYDPSSTSIMIEKNIADVVVKQIDLIVKQPVETENEY